MITDRNYITHWLRTLQNAFNLYELKKKNCNFFESVNCTMDKISEVKYYTANN